MSRCAECDQYLTYDPEAATWEGDIDGFVEFTYSVPGSSSETELFCSPKCLADAHLGENNDG